MDCLFDDDESHENAVLVDGIVVRKIGFKPSQLAVHDGEIRAMLAELPEVFMKNKGGGMSFLEAWEDRHDKQWTGDQHTMDMLFVLGIAIGAVEYQLPRDFWHVFPGGVPYVTIDLAGTRVEKDTSSTGE